MYFGKRTLFKFYPKNIILSKYFFTKNYNFIVVSYTFSSLLITKYTFDLKSFPF